MKYTIKQIWNTPRKFTILIVEDEQQSLNIIIKALESFLSGDYHLYPAVSLKQALDICNKIVPDVAIVDYNLPDGDGIELARYLRSNFSQTPILMITGMGADIKEEALEAGVNVFLEKPLRLLEFLSLIKNLLSISKATKDLTSAQELIQVLLHTIELRDKYTEGHSFRVANYSLKIAQEAGIKDKKSQRDLYVGCILHDIGKIGIPDQILKTDKTPLSSEEFEIIKSHPLKGYNICKEVDTLRDVLPIIKHHHEKLDGSGYPDGLVENQIPEIVQISTIADIYDALTSDRSYREKNNPKTALKMIEKEAEQKKINKELFRILSKLVENGNI